MEQPQPGPEIGPKIDEALSRESMQHLMAADVMSELGEFLLFKQSEALANLQERALAAETNSEDRLILIDQWDELAHQEVQSARGDASMQIGLEFARASLWLRAGNREKALEIADHAMWKADGENLDFVRERYNRQFDDVDERLAQIYPENG